MTDISYPYSMFSEHGGKAVDNIVYKAMQQDWSWDTVRQALESLANTDPLAGEARDTAVRESVLIALGFDRGE